MVGKGKEKKENQEGENHSKVDKNVPSTKNKDDKTVGGSKKRKHGELTNQNHTNGASHQTSTKKSSQEGQPQEENNILSNIKHTIKRRRYNPVSEESKHGVSSRIRSNNKHMKGSSVIILNNPKKKHEYYSDDDTDMGNDMIFDDHDHVASKSEKERKQQLVHNDFYNNFGDDFNDSDF